METKDQGDFLEKFRWTGYPTSQTKKTAQFTLTLEYMKERVAQGASQRQIAEELNNLGARNPYIVSGKWDQPSVSKWCRARGFKQFEKKKPSTTQEQPTLMKRTKGAQFTQKDVVDIMSADSIPMDLRIRLFKVCMKSLEQY